ncbi:MAG: hypothetical protein HKO05_02630 [Erythrobacter sp.]|nr:hypothetical protein [Erythrobacter sp.]
MSEYEIVQIVALTGFLVLAASALASYRLDWKSGIRMVLIWGCIFAAVVFFITFFELA